MIEKYQNITPVKSFEMNGKKYIEIEEDLKKMVEEGKKIVRIDMSVGMSYPTTNIYRVYHIDPKDSNIIKMVNFYKSSDMIEEDDEEEDIFF